jgi:cytochrome c553
VKPRFLFAALYALYAGGAAAPAHAHDPNLARDLAATCTGCHGTDGRSAGAIPALAGVPADVLMQKLAGFRSGERPATIMHQIAKGYTDEQLRLIAVWFAARR